MNSYVEQQRVKSPIILVIVCPLILTVGLALLQAGTQSIYLVVFISIFSLLCILICVALMFLAVRTVVSDRSLTIQLFPFTFVKLTVEKADIVLFRMKRLDKIEKMEELEKIKIQSVKVNLRRLSILLFKGTHALWVKTRNGDEILIGTRHPAKLIRSIWSGN